MRILLFGCNGQVARCIKDAASEKDEVIALGSTNGGDLHSAGIADAAINAHRPDCVINAAAYTAVDRAENENDIAMRLNAAAVAEIAQSTKHNGIPFLHISTDYVFDGNQDDPYKESDPTNPLNVYGASKLAGEVAALENNKATVILRTSWVFSEYGTNFVKTMLRLATEHDALSIVDDQIGGPTSAHDIAHAVLSIAQKRHRGAAGDGIYHFQGAPAASWADFARKIFEFSESKTTVTPIPSAQFPTPAARPLRTVLDCARLTRDFGISQPDWRPALRQVIEALQKKDEQP